MTKSNIKKTKPNKANFNHSNPQFCDEYLTRTTITITILATNKDKQWR